MDYDKVMREVRIAALEDEIQRAKHLRYFAEMSDDYCHINGKYAQHTAHIDQLEAQIAILMKEA